MTEAPVDLRKLAAEAAREAYSPRARRCWFPWSHRWTMWEVNWRSGDYVSDFQRRRCLRCGKTVEKLVY